MAAIGRREILACILGCPALLPAELNDELRDVVARMATSLSAGNVSGFMKCIDPAMKGAAELRVQVAGLIAFGEISSSVQLQSNAGDNQTQSAKVDWYLQLRSQTDGATSLQKRELLSLGFARKSKNWLVSSIEPPSFFTASE